jgi:hypothetical protein
VHAHVCRGLWHPFRHPVDNDCVFGSPCAFTFLYPNLIAFVSRLSISTLTLIAAQLRLPSQAIESYSEELPTFAKGDVLEYGPYANVRPFQVSSSLSAADSAEHPSNQPDADETSNPFP